MPLQVLVHLVGDLVLDGHELVLADKHFEQMEETLFGLLALEQHLFAVGRDVEVRGHDVDHRLGVGHVSSTVSASSGSCGDWLTYTANSRATESTKARVLDHSLPGRVRRSRKVTVNSGDSDTNDSISTRTLAFDHAL